ncbi:TIGR03986 family CRISPR-associated RAMP protein [Leptolyngbya sp. FACHB-711]|uniref:TIGR03986 family type III CRISPR-associated RAMP protein n=1 Tax=Leptolyngbya sp. FACHB-711 TaxID=2692813 RepID=UPI0016881F99|nr:TIGR03986 family CRISPR-associated RAMP protein [Leptolyngbya sp. FACHB-711]MBD2028256.1 TIGR03986 family CRISPR-associated RAMP protein [Leptolyngbya sp. FACHB-711]
MAVGTLILVGKSKTTLQVRFTNKNGKEVTTNIRESELSAVLLNQKKGAIAKLEGLEVEFEEAGGQPTKIREKGQLWVQASANAMTSASKSSNMPQPSHPWIKGNFHNPYNFVPALPRNPERFEADLAKELGDHPPVPHGVYCGDYWSGKITVTLTAKTPLLIPDAANAKSHPNNSDHKIYLIRRNAQNQPYIPSTSVKGTLRSAYEAVTNSRLSVFQGHIDRLAYRMPAKIEANLFPARVERKGDELLLRIMKTAFLGHAAKLPRYKRSGSPPDKGERVAALKYENTNQLPQHGDAVWVKVSEGFVTQIRSRGSSSSPSKDWEKGWVCVTGPNINGKKNERVFLENSQNEMLAVTPEIKALWEELIKNYQKTHEKKIEARRKEGKQPSAYLGKNPGDTGFSRHVYDVNELVLEEGRLCYVEYSHNRVNALIPVTISRRLYKKSPEKLLPSSLEPAASINHFSPADRVFGWVKQGSDRNDPRSSYKGNLRISTVECVTPDAIERFPGHGLPLAILGEPKPQQTRFYAATDKLGSPLAEGANKEEGYQDETKGLRGRKVYPHHCALPTGYWDDPMNPAQKFPNDYYREYRQLEGEDQISDQNRSIQEWIKPGTQFKFEMNVTNLSNVELGALLWLLDLPDEHFHRLGGGKPLGFGSIQLKIDWEHTDLRIGSQWKEFYRSLLPVQQTLSQSQECKQAFQKAIVEAYSNEFERVSFIAAFLRCAKGFEDSLPIHYPRLQQKPTSEGKVFGWFIANERTGKNGGRKLPLPHLIDDSGLPFMPTQQ